MGIEWFFGMLIVTLLVLWIGSLVWVNRGGQS